MSSLPQQLTPTTNPRQSSAYIRKAISTKKRFEIFKRDNFICQYCGRTPDDGVILHVDHIIPVAKGGENEDINLTTSCFDCNSGKRDGLISVSPEALSIADVNKGLEEELKSRKELESQLKAYYQFKKKLKSYDPTAKFLNGSLSKELGFSLTDDAMKGFLSLYKKLSLEDFIDAVNIVKKKFDIDETDLFSSTTVVSMGRWEEKEKRKKRSNGSGSALIILVP